MPEQPAAATPTCKDDARPSRRRRLVAGFTLLLAVGFGSAGTAAAAHQAPRPVVSATGNSGCCIPPA